MLYVPGPKLYNTQHATLRRDPRSYRHPTRVWGLLPYLCVPVCPLLIFHRAFAFGALTAPLLLQTLYFLSRGLHCFCVSNKL